LCLLGNIGLIREEVLKKIKKNDNIKLIYEKKTISLQIEI